MMGVVGVLPAFHLRQAIHIEGKASITGWPGGGYPVLEQVGCWAFSCSSPSLCLVRVLV